MTSKQRSILTYLTVPKQKVKKKDGVAENGESDVLDGVQKLESCKIISSKINSEAELHRFKGEGIDVDADVSVQGNEISKNVQLEMSANGNGTDSCSTVAKEAIVSLGMRTDIVNGAGGMVSGLTVGGAQEDEIGAVSIAVESMSDIATIRNAENHNFIQRSHENETGSNRNQIMRTDHNVSGLGISKETNLSQDIENNGVFPENNIYEKGNHEDSTYSKRTSCKQMSKISLRKFQDQNDESAVDMNCVSGMTNAEAARLERIQRNMEKMRSLGLGLDGTAMLPLNEKKQISAPRGRKRSMKSATIEPARRSARLSGQTGFGFPEIERGEKNEEIFASAECKTHVKEDEKYEDSSIYKYLCNHISNNANENNENCVLDKRSLIQDDVKFADQIVGFGRMPGLLRDKNLQKAYSLDWSPGLILAGGKNGNACIWGIASIEYEQTKASRVGTIDLATSDIDCMENEVQIESHLSTRLHRGWISDVQFLSRSCHIDDHFCEIDVENSLKSSNHDLKFLTAGNDGALCLWDATKSSTAVNGYEKPECIWVEEPHEGSGIFSMSEIGGYVLTGGKDFSVIVGDIDACGSFRVMNRFVDLHEGVVKCARWKPQPLSNADKPSIFASCGNDKCIRLMDIRESYCSASQNSGIVMGNHHNTSINCIRWSPKEEYKLISSSHDPFIFVHDIRQPEKPVIKLFGHANANKRIASIIQPTFVNSGSAIVTTGDRSSLLTIYDAHSGKLISQGDAEMNLGALCSPAQQCDLLFCTGNKCAAIFSPIYDQKF